MKFSNKKIEKQIIVSLSLHDAWAQWTTHEGLLTFFGADNKIELTPGGVFEIYFLMDEPCGLRGSEGCKVLSFLPDKMLSFSWNAPPKYPDIRESEYKTWVVIEFKKMDTSNTELTLTHLGWPDDSSWDPVFEYFKHAWETVLDWLQKSIT